MTRIIILSDEEKAAALVDAEVWVVMQNDSPIGVEFSEAAAQYQADSARLQYPYLARRRGMDWQHPIGCSYNPGPYFHVRGPFTAGKLSAL